MIDGEVIYVYDVCVGGGGLGVVLCHVVKMPSMDDRSTEETIYICDSWVVVALVQLVLNAT